MRHLVAIMAGGRGERLWPHSRARLPKQFLSLGGGPTFLQRTHARVAGLLPAPDLCVLTSRDALDLVRQQLPDLAADRLVGEPVARDTAATAALAGLVAEALAGGEGAVVALVPADHAVFDEDGFRAALTAAFAAAEREGVPVLVGIPPTRPETGYGYIRRGSALANCAGMGVAAVEAFVEKPTLERAAQYLTDGRHLWNSGICVCRSDVLLEQLASHQRGLGGLIRALRGQNPALAQPGVLQQLLEPLEAISLDYALLEHVQRAAVVLSNLAWDDVGSWEALGRLHPQDAHGNVCLGRAVLSETERTMVYSSAEGRLLVTHGVEDLVVVDTPDSTLVVSRQALPGLKRALGAVRASGYQEYLDRSAAVASCGREPSAPGPAVLRPEDCPGEAKPWGREVWWARSEHYAAKRLEITAGESLSLHYHRRKHETLYFLEGLLRLRLDDAEHLVRPGQVASIPPGTVHRLEALTAAVVFEASTSELEDTVRLEDRYGRADQR